MSVVSSFAAGTGQTAHGAQKTLDFDTVAEGLFRSKSLEGRF